MKKIIFALMILTLSIDVHALTKNEKAFIEAAENGDIETVRYLINSEVDIDAQDQEGNTALMLASQNGYFDIVKLLVDNGAYIDIKNKYGITAIDYSRNSEILKLFMDIAPYYILNNKEILIYQSNFDNEENVKILLNNGIDVNYIGPYGTTAIILARSIEIVKILIDAGANINMQDNNGNTILMNVSARGQSDILELLLEHGANINIKDKYGRTAFTYAVSAGNDNIIKILLKNGYNINTQNNNDGNTALSIAVLSGNSSTVKLLLDYSADHSIKNKYGQTAMDIAKKEKNYEIIGILEHYRK